MSAEEEHGGRLAEARLQLRQAKAPCRCPDPPGTKHPAFRLLADHPARCRHRTAVVRQSPVPEFSALSALRKSAARSQTPGRELNLRLLLPFLLSKARGIPRPRPTAQTRRGRRCESRLVSAPNSDTLNPKLQSHGLGQLHRREGAHDARNRVLVSTTQRIQLARACGKSPTRTIPCRPKNSRCL